MFHQETCTLITSLKKDQLVLRPNFKSKKLIITKQKNPNCIHVRELVLIYY